MGKQAGKKESKAEKEARLAKQKNDDARETTPNGANLSTPDITGQGAKYALNRMYGLWVMI